MLIGAAKVKLENKGDLSFFNRQDDSVTLIFYFSIFAKLRLLIVLDYLPILETFHSAYGCNLFA